MSRRFRNPQYAPESLERRLKPSAFVGVPAYVVHMSAVTPPPTPPKPTNPPPPVNPDDPGGPPISGPTIPSGPSVPA